MAHFNRPSSSYAVRNPSNVARQEHYYDRDRRPIYPSMADVDYARDEQMYSRREPRTHYPPSEDIMGPPRDHPRTDTWQAHPPDYVRRAPSSSAGPPQFYDDYRPHPPQPLPPHPQHSQWEEHPRWENEPDHRSFEPSVSWRQMHRENEIPHSPHAPVPVHPDERRWREPVQTAQSHWDTTREYPLDHPSHEGHPSGYYDYDRPYPEAEAYKTHTVYDDQPPHWSSRRSSPAQRGRSNSLRDHSRQRTMSVGHSPHVSDSSTPNWTRDRDIDVPRHSREGSFASPAPRITDRERPFTGSAPQRSSYSIPAPSPQSANPVRDTWSYSTDQSPVPRELQSESIPRSTRAFAPSPGIPDSLRKTGNVEERVPTDSRDFHARSNENFANSLPSPIKTAPTIQQPSSWNASYNQDSSAVHSIRNLPSETNLASKGVFQSSDSRGQDNTHGERQSEVGMSSITNIRPPIARRDPSPNRQGLGVLSVKELVSPTPIKPLTSTSVNQPRTSSASNDDRMQIDEPTITRVVSANRMNEVRSGTVERALPVDEVETQHPTSVFPSRATSPQNSPAPSVDVSRPETPDLPTPPDVPEPVSNPKTSNIVKPLPVPSLKEVPDEERTLRILPRRPRADDKLINEALRQTIVIRRAFMNQTREQRVNPVLMVNLSLAEDPSERDSSDSDTLCKEVFERLSDPGKEEQHMLCRANLAAKLASERELLAEKQQRLRDEYLRLHQKWLVHCAKLDSLAKANDMQEAIMNPGAITGRTTRRSAANLGDAARSDFEMEQIIANLGNEELTDPNHLSVRNVAKIPDMLSVVKGRVPRILDDDNGRVENPEVFYDPRSGYHDWTPEEEEIMLQRYADHPKQFGIISKFLENKTTRQCILYYYMHKKRRIVDFRNAANSSSGKRRGKGFRKSGKQKGNALLVDVAAADSKRPAGRGRGRRGRGGASAGDGTGRGRGAASTPASTPGPAPSAEEGMEPEIRPKRRRTTQQQTEDAVHTDLLAPKGRGRQSAASKKSEQTSQTPSTAAQTPVPIEPPKKRRGRIPKPKPTPEEVVARPPSTGAATTSNATPPPATRFVHPDDPLPAKRKTALNTNIWSVEDKELFIKLLAEHGPDFKRISVRMPLKTTIQCTNFYKANCKELGLDVIAAKAVSRPSPEPEDSMERIAVPMPMHMHMVGASPVMAVNPIDRQVADVTSGTGVLTLEQTMKPTAAGTLAVAAATHPKVAIPSSASSRPGSILPNTNNSINNSSNNGVMMMSNQGGRVNSPHAANFEARTSSFQLDTSIPQRYSQYTYPGSVLPPSVFPASATAMSRPVTSISNGNPPMTSLGSSSSTPGIGVGSSSAALKSYVGTSTPPTTRDQKSVSSVATPQTTTHHPINQHYAQYSQYPYGSYNISPYTTYPRNTGPGPIPGAGVRVGEPQYQNVLSYQMYPSSHPGHLPHQHQQHQQHQQMTAATSVASSNPKPAINESQQKKTGE